jgi:hypothetical protein
MKPSEIDWTKYKLVPIQLSDAEYEFLDKIVLNSTSGKQIWDRFMPYFPHVEDIE